MSASQTDCALGEADGYVDEEGCHDGDHAGEKGILAPLFGEFQVSLVEGTTGEACKVQTSVVYKYHVQTERFCSDAEQKVTVQRMRLTF